MNAKKALMILLPIGFATLAITAFWVLFMATPAEQTKACTTSDYAHIPYAEEYDFECTDTTMTVYDGYTGKEIAVEERCTDDELKAEDGSCVPDDFYDDATTSLGVDLQPQRLIEGKWVALPWSDYQVMPTNTKIDELYPKDNFGGDSEELRYEVTVYNLDNNGDTRSFTKFYTD